MNDGAEVKVSPQVRALVKNASAQEGEEPTRVLEALVRHGLAYRAAIRSGARIVKEAPR